MEQTSIQLALRLLEDQVNNYLDQLCLASQIAQEQKSQDDETIKIQKDIDAVKKKISELDLLSENITKENEVIDEDIKNNEIKIEKIQAICNKLNVGLKTTESDSSRLAKARNMWYIGEELTGINWNYSAPDNIISGYIANQSKNSLEPFEFDTTKLQMAQITNELWNRIGSSSSSTWNDLKDLFYSNSTSRDKENIHANN